MYCSNCGTQLTEGVNYCSNCGQPQKSTSKTTSKPTQLEVCNVTIGGGLLTVRWEAWVNRQRIAQGDEYTEIALNLAEKHREKNIELVSRLMSQGWEVLTTNETGCVTSMRRSKVS